MSWTVYTDGACGPKNPGYAAWGAVILSPEGGEPMRHNGYIGAGTNQIAELTAAIEGLSLIPEGAHIKLVSDSQYVLKGLTEWRSGWERRGWRNSVGEPVANADLWRKLFAAYDRRKVTTQWVKGHNGDRFNEEADQLAVAALKAKRSSTSQESGTISVCIDYKTRTIEAMCLTTRHDFGLEKQDGKFGAGMTEAERQALRAEMGQLYDHHIAPLVKTVEFYAQGVQSEPMGLGFAARRVLETGGSC